MLCIVLTIMTIAGMIGVIFMLLLFPIVEHYVGIFTSYTGAFLEKYVEKLSVLYDRYNDWVNLKLKNRGKK